MLGMVRESPDVISREMEAVQALTNRSFAVKLIPAATHPDLLRAAMDACLDLHVPAFNFFWDPVPSAIDRAKAAGADALIAQGEEARGHVHGTTGALVPTEQIACEAKVPVVASGGFATGASLAAALALGAQGIQCGTAFLATRESYAHNHHKQRIVQAEAEDTAYTDVHVLNWLKGAPVRVLRNSVIEALGYRLTGHDPEDLPHEVVAHDEDRPLLRLATDSPLRGTEGDLEAMAH